MLAFSIAAPAQVFISEFMADNKSTLADEDGLYADWIELYNLSNEDVDISNFVLTDKPDINKFIFPAVTVVPAHGFLALSAGINGFENASSYR